MHPQSTGAIDKGKEVHDEISRQVLLEHDIVLGGALMHMYLQVWRSLPGAKCPGAKCPREGLFQTNAVQGHPSN